MLTQTNTGSRQEKPPYVHLLDKVFFTCFHFVDVVQHCVIADRNHACRGLVFNVIFRRAGAHPVCSCRVINYSHGQRECSEQKESDFHTNIRNVLMKQMKCILK